MSLGSKDISFNIVMLTHFGVINQSGIFFL